MTADREDDDLVVIAAFTSVHDALLAQNILDGAGIDSVLDDEHIVSMQWEQQREARTRALLARIASLGL